MGAFPKIEASCVTCGAVVGGICLKGVFAGDRIIRNVMALYNPAVDTCVVDSIPF